MARTMNINNTEIYRTVVDQFFRGDQEADAIQTTAYGPHHNKASNKDYTDSEWGTGGKHGTAPRRITKQQLVPMWLAGAGSVLDWFTYSVTYENGGEDVNWDDF